MTLTANPLTTRVIDVDSHLMEPPDLWTTRMPKKWIDRAPHVELSEDGNTEWWVLAGDPMMPVAQAAQAGWTEFAPDYPPRWSDAQPETWDANERLRWMDLYSIYAQVLYPNLALFHTASITSTSDAAFMLSLIKTYNDFQTEWVAADPKRFVPTTVVPFWSRDDAVAEMQRCYEMGHRGMAFSQEPGNYGHPMLVDRHWDPIWAAAQELGIPINFHIGSGNMVPKAVGDPAVGGHANFAMRSVFQFSTNAVTIVKLIGSGICHRFPDLPFVTVESGVGWIPFTLDALDWQWKTCGVRLEHPEYGLLPSEYFARQIYGCFWFEEEGARYAIERVGSRNFLFETDFPHPTSMSPGPGTTAVGPDEFIRNALGDLNADDLGNVLFHNASRVFTGSPDAEVTPADLCCCVRLLTQENHVSKR